MQDQVNELKARITTLESEKIENTVLLQEMGKAIVKMNDSMEKLSEIQIETREQNAAASEFMANLASQIERIINANHENRITIVETKQDDILDSLKETKNFFRNIAVTLIAAGIIAFVGAVATFK